MFSGWPHALFTTNYSNPAAKAELLISLWVFQEQLYYLMLHKHYLISLCPHQVVPNFTDGEPRHIKSKASIIFGCSIWEAYTWLFWQQTACYLRSTAPSKFNDHCKHFCKSPGIQISWSENEKQMDTYAKFRATVAPHRDLAAWFRTKSCLLRKRSPALTIKLPFLLLQFHISTFIFYFLQWMREGSYR